MEYMLKNGTPKESHLTMTIWLADCELTTETPRIWSRWNQVSNFNRKLSQFDNLAESRRCSVRNAADGTLVRREAPETSNGDNVEREGK